MIYKINLEECDNEIIIKKGLLSNLENYLNLNRKVIIITDSGIPANYIKYITDLSPFHVVVVLEQGEKSKSFENYLMIIQKMIHNSFDRFDCVVSIGGGMVGDLGGFVASTYMRGIDFYNIPTTLLSQVDSAVGGKTAINYENKKNIIGSFYFSKKTLIDPEVLSTLPQRQFNSGMAEIIKIAVTLNSELFYNLYNKDIDMENIIYQSVIAKNKIVSDDIKEQSVRKVLNFGHTLGHGFEIESQGELLHGEAVGLGMLPMCSADVSSMIKQLLKKYSLPTQWNGDIQLFADVIALDKKKNGDKISIVYVDRVGHYDFIDQSLNELISTVKNFYF